MTMRVRSTLLAAIAGLAIGAPAWSQDEEPAIPPPVTDIAQEGLRVVDGVSVTEFGTVEIFVQNESLTAVLYTLAIEAGRNIVTTAEAERTVSANISGVDLERGLEILLDLHGLDYVEQDDFILVYSKEQLDAMRPRVTRVLTLKHLTAADASEFVTPLLSETGTLTASREVEEWEMPEDDEDRPAGKDDYAQQPTLVIHDYEDNIRQIEDLLRKLDVKPLQVLVEATVLQVRLTEANAYGVDFALIQDVQFTEFFGFGLDQNPFTPFTGDNRISGEDVTSTATSAVRDNDSFLGTNVGNQGGDATIRGGIISGNSAVFLRALDRVTDVTLMANPKILALNRQRARVQVGRRVGFLSTSVSEDGSEQSVQFLDTGVLLTFRPFVSPDGTVRLELKPKISEVTFRQVQDVLGRLVEIPDEDVQELSTNITVPEGSTIVLGGMFSETTNLSRSQIPFLGDIPLIGAAFRGHDDDTVRVETLFLLRPTIIRDDKLIEDGRLAAEEAERVRVGTREGLLPWSRERHTAMLNVDAVRYAEQGERDKALWMIRRSLQLAPIQPDAIRIREQLLTDPRIWPQESLTERALHHHLYRVLDVPPAQWTPEPYAAPSLLPWPAQRDQMPPTPGTTEPMAEPARPSGGGTMVPHTPTQPAPVQPAPVPQPAPEPAAQPAPPSAPAQPMEEMVPVGG